SELRLTEVRVTERLARDPASLLRDGERALVVADGRLEVAARICDATEVHPTVGHRRRVDGLLAQLERALECQLGLREIAGEEVERAFGVLEARHRHVPRAVADRELLSDAEALFDVGARLLALALRVALERERAVDAHLQRRWWLYFTHFVCA